MNSTQQKQVLYISYDGMTDPLGQSQVIPYIIGLSQKGYSFTILSCEKRDRYAKNKEAIQNLLTAAFINWQPVFYTKSPPVLSTLYDYNKLKRKAQQLHSRLHFDVIHCRSYIPALVGQWMKKRYQVPFIFDMRGFWADERVDGGLWNLKNPVHRSIYSYFKKKEIQFLNECAAIVSLTEAGKNEIITWRNVKFNPDKIAVIPCCADTDLFDPAKISPREQEAIRQKLNIQYSDLVFGYLGSIGTWYMLDEMMQFFSMMKKEVNHAKFLFVTHDSYVEIMNKAKEFDVADTIIITAATRKEVPLLISLFNYGLFFIKPAYSKIASSPTKQGEIMAMAIPVICNSGVGDTDKITAHYKAGLIVTENGFTAAVQKIAGGINYNKEGIRAGAIDYFSLKKGIDKYYQVYIEICNP